MTEFKTPSFDGRCLELRCEKGEVLIYGNKRGIERLAQLCLDLLKQHGHESTAHLHLNEYEVLTDESLPGVVAFFK